MMIITIISAEDCFLASQYLENLYILLFFCQRIQKCKCIAVQLRYQKFSPVQRPKPGSILQASVERQAPEDPAAPSSVTSLEGFKSGGLRVVSSLFLFLLNLIFRKESKRSVQMVQLLGRSCNLQANEIKSNYNYIACLHKSMQT